MITIIIVLQLFMGFFQSPPIHLPHHFQLWQEIVRYLLVCNTTYLCILRKKTYICKIVKD